MRSAKWVKPGGALVYASCSIFMAEGEKIKEAFLNHRQDFIVDAEQRLFPGADGGDGFYMVKFLRKEMLKQSHPAEAEA
jgi:16S rRNA (cytosine967-C5)-methyltransferase